MSQYMLDRWGRDEGLPTAVIWDITQDRDGYLWLATQNGLTRFDGVRFVTHDSATDPAFTANDIRAVHETADGTIWAGIYGGGVVRLDPDGFTRFGTRDGLVHEVVYTIHESTDGTLWFGTGGGVTRLTTDGEFRSWTPADGLAHARVYSIDEQSDGTLWFGTLTGGLSRFDGERFENFGADNGLDGDQIHLVYRDRADSIWVSTYAGGVFRITDDAPRPVAAAGALPEGFIVQSALEDRHGALWLGSYGSGLARIVDGAVETFESPGDVGAVVFALHEDREANLWIGTLDGLYRMRDGKFQLFGEPEGLADNTYVVLEDPRSDALWVGTEGHGLYRIENGGITRYTSQDGLAADSVSALAADPDGTLWVGTFGGGMHRLDPDGTLAAHYDASDGLPSNHIFAIQRRADGSLWIAADGGIAVMRDGGIESLTVEDGLPDTLTRVLVECRQGDLWLGTNAGLARLREDGIRTWTADDGLAANQVIAIHEDEDGVLWLGSRSQGLSRFDDGEIFAFDESHGLPQLSVLRILEDDAGYLWMSGHDGLVRVPRAGLNAVAAGAADTIEAEHFTRHDGLRSSQFMTGFQPNGWRSRDGTLWFPTLRGLAGIDPAAIRRNPHPPPVYIEAVRVDGEPRPLTDPLVLDPAQSNLQVDYTGISLSSPGAVRFRFMLEGVDTAWHEAGNRRTAYYTRMPAGEFVFRVTAANEDGVWNEAGASLRIKRVPHFHETAWFYALVALGLLMLSWAIYRLAHRHARVRQVELETLVQERTAQLEEALGKVEKLSREDSLTGLSNRRCFEEVLETEWARAMREQKPVSIIMMDLDHFKPLNDNQGHQAGDDCLERVAQVLNAGVNRSTDLVARYGGEEFVLLLPGTDADTAVHVADKLRERVKALGIEHPHGGIGGVVTISAGTATTVPQRGEVPDPLIQRADRAMYEAKRTGRDRVVKG